MRVSLPLAYANARLHPNLINMHTSTKKISFSGFIRNFTHSTKRQRQPFAFFSHWKAGPSPYQSMRRYNQISQNVWSRAKWGQAQRIAAPGQELVESWFGGETRGLGLKVLQRTAFSLNHAFSTLTRFGTRYHFMYILLFSTCSLLYIILLYNKPHSPPG